MGEVKRYSRKKKYWLKICVRKLKWFQILSFKFILFAFHLHNLHSFVTLHNIMGAYVLENMQYS